MLKGRLEDDRMLTGRGRYVSDWNLPGQAQIPEARTVSRGEWQSEGRRVAAA